MRLAIVVFLTLAAGSSVWAAESAVPDEAAAANTPKFTVVQLEELVAPIALYPDAITVQVLMASTYPLEIVEAARWRSKNKSLQGDALEKALEAQEWDPSVESLTHFPDLLQRMSDNLDWTKDLGDAFLEQKDAVLDAVQRMRGKAYEAGTLKTTQEQVVTREIVKEKEIIRVEPANPEVVYVPTYAPETAYGSTWAPPPQPYYPTMMTYPPGYVATAGLLSFGAGMAVGAAVWGDCDWDNHDVYNDNYNNGGGNNNSNNNVNVNNEKNVDRSKTKVEGGQRGQGSRGGQWQHDPSHRSGVRYRDQATAKKYEGGDRVAARERADQNTARGYDRGQGGRPSQQPAGQGGQNRPSADGRSGQARAGGGAQGGRSQAGTQPARQRSGGGASASQQPTRSAGASSRASAGTSKNAFGGYESGRSAQQASARGAESRGRTSYGGAGGGGGGRGGGGGGGGRGGRR